MGAGVALIGSAPLSWCQCAKFLQLHLASRTLSVCRQGPPSFLREDFRIALFPSPVTMRFQVPHRNR